MYSLCMCIIVLNTRDFLFFRFVGIKIYKFSSQKTHLCCKYKKNPTQVHAVIYILSYFINTNSFIDYNYECTAVRLNGKLVTVAHCIRWWILLNNNSNKNYVNWPVFRYKTSSYEF